MDATNESISEDPQHLHALLEAMAAIVGDEHVSASRDDRIAYGTDFWTKAQLWKMRGFIDPCPAHVIVWPASQDEVKAIVTHCYEHHVPVVPFGGGSGVCGGTLPIRGGVVMDMKRMQRIHRLDPISMTVVVDAGMIGQHLEDALNARGFTLGHFPSSIMCSTVGGWLATRSGGQFSSKYGKIEDMVLNLKAISARGELLDTAARLTGAPDWTQILVGSEGTLGTITQAEFKIRPLPKERRFLAWRFHRMDEALRGMRAVMQAGLQPMVLRLYDPFDSMIALGKQVESEVVPTEGPTGAIHQFIQKATRPAAEKIQSKLKPLTDTVKRRALAGVLRVPALTNRLANAAPSPSLLIIGFEGEPEDVKLSLDESSEIFKRHGGQNAGSKLGESWLEKRYSVGFKQTRLLNMGVWVDTMEVATTWDRLEALYRAVRKAVSPHAFIMAHFSHAYREGCSIYFTMAGHRSRPEEAERHYEHTWAQAMEAVISAGGTLSHHHGIGLLKMDAMPREHGEMVRAWRALKASLDPHSIMNPGKLFPDAIPQVLDDAPSRPMAHSAVGPTRAKRAPRDPEAALRAILPSEQMTLLQEGNDNTGAGWAIEPATHIELVEVLKWATKRHAAVFTRRSRRGDAELGGTRPRLYLRSHRMKRILDTDLVSGTIRVQTGISMAELHRALAERSFTTGFPTRLWREQPLGAVLAASLDAHWGPRFGSPESEVLGLGVVFPDGTVAHSKVAPRKAVGPDFDRLLLGSRGRYGIIFEATIRIYPNVSRTIRSFAARNLTEALLAVQEAIARGLDPRAIELLSPAEDRIWAQEKVGLSAERPVLVVIEPWTSSALSHRDLNTLMGPRLEPLAPPIGWNIHDGLLPSPRAWTAPVVPVKMADLMDLAAELGPHVPPGLWIVRMSRHGGHLSLAEPRSAPTSDAESAEVQAGRTVRSFVANHQPGSQIWLPYQRAVKRQLDPKGVLNPNA